MPQVVNSFAFIRVPAEMRRTTSPITMITEPVIRLAGVGEARIIKIIPPKNPAGTRKLERFLKNFANELIPFSISQ